MGKDKKITLRLHIWFESEKGMLFGTGRAQLLEKIVEFGSLNKAAQEMGMSYRAAWGRLKQTEEALGEELVIRHGGRKGYTLSPVGQELLAAYKKWFAKVESYALECAREEMPWDVSPFEEDEL